VTRVVVGALVIATLASACGGGVAGGSRAPSATATGGASASPTALASATPMTSARGSITVRTPLSGARVTSPLAITGDASVFEAALQWRLVDSGGRVVVDGIATASAGAPARGTFSVGATFTPPAADTTGVVEVYDRSPKDGQIDEIVRVPVVIAH